MICRDAVELASRSLDQPLTWVDRFSLWVHTTFCRRCRRFRHQSAIVDQCARHYFEPSRRTPLPMLGDDAKARIREAIARNRQH